MENDFDIEKTIRGYLPEILHMSLATCAGNKPWVCEVHFVYDDELNLYFRSMRDTRHCQEIAANPNVSGNIVTQHGISDKPRGLYFEGTAEVIEAIDENSEVFKLFRDRLGTKPEVFEDAGLGFYKISVSDWYVFDARESKPSQKYHLTR